MANNKCIFQSEEYYDIIKPSLTEWMCGSNDPEIKRIYNELRAELNKEKAPQE